ncbi:MAG: flagellar motor switch protein FliN [Armatimonadota bacterium]|nr:flagellar motor switch protein FliN [bacterium]MCS7310168.1 flagellar motor switch protein FliN [Armatimonadota bacterium]MDW8105782.1 flagellar motor switch protein FliN [Armatimonadota bacterium]MDW8290773.1 flagellar motor switch protein FliN [Armatimonadota bacterium]
MAVLSLEHINTITLKQESLWGTVSISLSETMNRQTTFSSPLVTLLPLSEMESAFTGKRVYGVATLQANTNHTLLVVMEASSATTLADIAAGGDGSSPPSEVDENILQVIQQVLFVIASGFAQALTNLSGAECHVLQVEAHHDALQPPLDWLTQDNLLRIDVVLHVDTTPLGVISILGDERFGLWLAGEQEESTSSQNVDEPAGETPFQTLGAVDTTAAQFVPLAQSVSQPLPAGIELILDVPLELTVELGRKRMVIKEILELTIGSIVELDRVAGEPVDVLVNGRIMARGEVVVIEDNFGIRITEIINPQEQLVEISRRAVA